MHRISLFLMMLFNSLNVFSQFSKDASCQNARFDKKVDSYLSYSVPVISVDEAFRSKDNFVFLDAREKDEYNISHLPGAVYVGYDDFDIKKMNNILKDKKIVVYCSIGYRSEKIASKLRKSGYKNVFNLYGSIFEWANSGYEIEDIAGKKTNQLHTYNKNWSQWVTNPLIVKKW
ncbi:MAG: rhodanese-like domain-containing protein [Saprospiraceae bacterium]|nr:rhodanese-like domain-containing protein [Saprospiraceae bacterium]